MKSIRILILLVLTISMTQVSFGQTAKHKLADSYFAEFEFGKAAEIYEDILLKNTNDIYALKKAADCRKNLGDLVMAEKHLQVLASLPLTRAEDLLDYAHVLKMNSKYPEALEVYRKYATMKPDDERIQSLLKKDDWIQEIYEDSAIYVVNNSSVNSVFSDFAPSFVDDHIVFASGRGEGIAANKKYNWTNQSYLNLYSAVIAVDSSLTQPTVIDNEVNSRYHDGTVCFDRTSNQIYYTRNNYLKGRKAQSKEGNLNLALFIADYSFGELSNAKEFEHNNSEYSVGHPAISSDGKVLVFVSDMPEGQGGTDLYVCEKQGDLWTEPKNLGPQVNTPGNEMFPFISDDNTLYFSSDGHIGLGGLDLFSCENFPVDLSPQNFGYPMNSPYDDFGLITFPNGKAGYFSSNRPGGKGDDDLYEFSVVRPPIIRVSGRIVDKDTKKPLKDVQMIIKDYNPDKVLKVVANSSADGRFVFELPWSKSYTIISNKEGYFQEEVTVNADEKKAYIENVDIEMEAYDFASVGHVYFAESGQPADEALMTLYNIDDNEIATMLTNIDGSYFFGLHENTQYTLKVEYPGYPEQEIAIDTRTLTVDEVKTDFRLFQIEKGALVKMDNIYYDYNKATIRNDAKRDLDRLAKIMVDNPTMRIELSSHSDSRGSDPYNLSLSKKRAQSAVDYLILKGIAADRLVPKGYGETRLLNHCKNGVKCSDEEHQENRRTEFLILDV